MIVDPITVLAFIPAALALNLTPGADMMFCIGQGLRGGPRAALAADTGIAAGGMVHTAIAGLGLGAVVAATPWAFDVIRWVGVGYLLWLIIRIFAGGAAENHAVPVRSSRAFRDALIVNLSNPKVILFVLAFIPQFVVPENGSVLGQFLIFGAILGIGGLLVNGLAGVSAARLGNALAGTPSFGRVISYVTASVYGALAIKLALTQRN